MFTQTSPALHIVADENIAYVEAAFGAWGTVSLYPGRQITPERVRPADVLLVRSVTPVDAALVAGSSLRFVGSATIGTDHIDRAALAEHGIAFAHAPGCNADAVVEYVLAALLRLSARRGEPLRGKTIGVVGCGQIGGRLAARLPALGVQVLVNDPPRAEAAARRGAAHPFIPLPALLAAADVVTLHVPLTTAGPHPTYHLIDEDALQAVRPGTWLVNAARGAVLDNLALHTAAQHLGALVLDVWEHEPTPDLTLLPRVDLATPHIAGYSYEGKVRGTIMLYQALRRLLALPDTWDVEAVLAPTPADHLTLSAPGRPLHEAAWLDAVVQQMYDISRDDARFRTLATLPPAERVAAFAAQRKHYPRRRTFGLHTIAATAVPPALSVPVARALCVRLADAAAAAPGTGSPAP